MTTPRTIRARVTRAEADCITVEVSGAVDRPPLELSSSTQVWQVPPPHHDFAAIALAQFAASEGHDLVVEGPVTSAQLDRIDEFLTIWSVWRPDKFRRVRVVAEEEVDPPDGLDRGGAVMGFSGGVDAGFALAAHHDGILGRLNRSIDLGVLVVGWDLRHGDSSGRERAAASAGRTLAAYGAELAVVSTNWKQDYCNAWFMSFNSGLASVLHTFAGSHTAAVHATDHSYLGELRMPPYGSSMITNHLLGNPWFPIVSTGGTHRRIDRVEFLGSHPQLLAELRVCYQPGAGGANCGHCEKCVRTQLELRACALPAGSFPSPMTVEDLRTATINNPTVLQHFEDILERMDPEDALRGEVEAWVAAHRPRPEQRAQRLRRRVGRLERRLERREAELLRLGQGPDGRGAPARPGPVDRARAVASGLRRRL